jgi:hypothetical protein
VPVLPAPQAEHAATELPTQATAEQARELTDRIKVAVEATWELVKTAYVTRAWTALGYSSWDDYCTREFGNQRIRLPREERQEVVASLRESGMSIRAISSATGTSVGTVAGHLGSSVQNRTVEQQAITGSNGKTYQPTQPRAQSWGPGPTRGPAQQQEPQRFECPACRNVYGADRMADSELCLDCDRNGNSPQGYLDDDVVDAEIVEDAAPEPFLDWSDDELKLMARLNAGETVVVSQRDNHTRFLRWADSEGKYVRVDRRTEWGNPFETPADGDRDTVIRHYAEHYLPHKPSLIAKLPSLRGKALGCWCAPLACHADVLKNRADS